MHKNWGILAMVVMIVAVALTTLVISGCPKPESEPEPMMDPGLPPEPDIAPPDQAPAPEEPGVEEDGADAGVDQEDGADAAVDGEATDEMPADDAGVPEDEPPMPPAGE